MGVIDGWVFENGYENVSFCKKVSDGFYIDSILRF